VEEKILMLWITIWFVNSPFQICQNSGWFVASLAFFFFFLKTVETSIDNNQKKQSEKHFVGTIKPEQFALWR
jgi:hypothetical protein